MKRNFVKSASGLFLENKERVLDLLSLNTCHRVGCSDITSGIAASCSTKPVAGTEVTVYLANRADIASVTPDGTNSMIITGITMNALKKFYAYVGIKTSNAPSVKMNKAKYQNNWEHLLDMLMFSNDGAAKKQLNLLAGAEVCAIVENKWKGVAGNMAFELYGWEVGLVLTAAERNPNDAETAGAWKLSLAHPEGQFESNPPLTIFDTDYDTSKSIVTSLI